MRLFHLPQTAFPVFPKPHSEMLINQRAEAVIDVSLKPKTKKNRFNQTSRNFFTNFLPA
jgi:hypothetical protein